MVKMASESEASCESDPNFAVICAFLEKFGVTCGITNIDFVELQEMLENTQEVSPELIDLHIKLLRKARKSVSSERWEKAIIKLCHGYCSQDAWEIERFGYKKARLTSKLRILKELLEMQFDFNAKFKAEINKLSAEELRTQPLGKDRLGHAYWLQCDESCQIRVYKEDSDEETWALVAKDRDGLVSLITQLKSKDTIKVGLEPIVNEDSNSLEVEKPLIDTGQPIESDTLKLPEKEQNIDNTKNEVDNTKNELVNDCKEEKQEFKIESTTQHDDENNKSEVIDNKKKDSENNETENKNVAATVTNKPTLRIKSISELMGQPAVETQHELVGVKDKYIRTEQNVEHRIPRLKVSMYSSHRKAVHSAGFDASDLKTTLKRTVQNDDIEAVHEVKRSRLNRPTLLGNKKSMKAYSDEEIEEPVMVITGQGSGYENECVNPIVSEEIQESVMYFCGEGNGRDCETGNEKEDENLDTKNSINECKCVNTLVDSECECSQKTLRNQYKLGTILDVRTDNNSKTVPRSPTKKSRWDIGKPPKDSENTNLTTSDDEICFKVPHQVEAKTGSKGKVQDLVGKWETLSSASKEEQQQPSQAQVVSPEVNSTPKQPMFFFGPGCLQFKPTVTSTLISGASNSSEKQKDSEKNLSVDDVKEGASEIQEIQQQRPEEDEEKLIAENIVSGKTLTREEPIMDQLEEIGTCTNTAQENTLFPQDTTKQQLDVNYVNEEKDTAAAVSESDRDTEDTVTVATEVIADSSIECVINQAGLKDENKTICIDRMNENKLIEDSSKHKDIAEKSENEINDSTTAEVRSEGSSVTAEPYISLKEYNLKLTVAERCQTTEVINPEKSTTDSKEMSIDFDSSDIQQLSKSVIASSDVCLEQHKEVNPEVKESLNSKPLKEVNKALDLQVENCHSLEASAKKVSEESKNLAALPDLQSDLVQNTTSEKKLPDCKISGESSVDIAKSSVVRKLSECSGTIKKEKDGSKQLSSASIVDAKNAGSTKVIETDGEKQLANKLNEKTQSNVSHLSNDLETVIVEEATKNDQTDEWIKEDMKPSNSRKLDAVEEAQIFSGEVSEGSKLLHLESVVKKDADIEHNKISKLDAKKITVTEIDEKSELEASKNLNMDDVQPIVTDSLSSKVSKEAEVNLKNHKSTNLRLSEIVAQDVKSVDVKVAEKYEKEVDNIVSQKSDSKVDILCVSNSNTVVDCDVKENIIEDRKDIECKKDNVTSTGINEITTKSDGIVILNQANQTETDSVELTVDNDCKSSELITETKTNLKELPESINETKKVLCDNIRDDSIKGDNLTPLETIEVVPSEPIQKSIILENKKEESASNKVSVENNEVDSKAPDLLPEQILEKTPVNNDVTEDDNEAVAAETVIGEQESIVPLTEKQELIESAFKIPVKEITSDEKSNTKEQKLTGAGDETQKALKLDDAVSDQNKATSNDDKVACTKDETLAAIVDSTVRPSKLSVKTTSSVDVPTKRNLRGRRRSDCKISQNEKKTIAKEVQNDTDEPSKKISKLETKKDERGKRVTRGSGTKPVEEVIEEKKPKPIKESNSKESEKKQAKVQKKAAAKKADGRVSTRRNTRSQSLKTDEIKEDLKPVVEPKCIKKHVPLLTVVSLSKLTGKPEIPIETVVANDATDGEDIIVVPETDPLACSEEEVQKPTVAPITLSSFSIDVEEVTPINIPTRRTRKRGHEVKVEITEVAEKKQKLRGKRSVDVGLRRSVEEQKRLVASSSDDDNGAQDFAVVEDEGQNEEEIPKKVSRRGRKKKVKRGFPGRRIARSPVSSSDVLSETSRTDSVNTPPVTKKSRNKKKTLMGLDIPSKIEDVNDTVTGVRQSRRIAQIKIKEEAERRKLEEIALNEIQADLKKTKGKKREDKDFKIKIQETKKRSKHQTEDEDTAEPEVSDDKKKRKRRKKHRNPNKIFDEHNPWRSSSDSSTSNEDEEEEEIVEYSEEEPATLLKSDHEFSPESDMEDTTDVQPLKRARTARKESDVEEVDDCACQKCGKSDHPEWILLCDGCDNGWHCSCLRPALLVIPEGDWYCPPCQHISLIKNLEERLLEYDKKLSKKGIEERRKERLAYVGISLNNVLPAKEPEFKVKGKKDGETDGSESERSDSGSDSGSTSDSDSEPIYQLRERRQAHSYRFNDYDELINSAIQDEMEAVKGAGNQGKGKDISTIVNAEKEEEAQRLKMQTIPEPLPPVVPRHEDEISESKNEDEDSDDAPIRPVKKNFGRKKPRKLNSLDVSSGDDAYDDEDFKGTSSTDDEEELDDIGSESSDDSTRIGRRRGEPVRRSTRARVSRYDREFINDDDSEEDEAPRRKKTRAIWDESESEESDRSWGRRKRKSGGRTTRRKSISKPKKSKKKKKVFDDSDSEIPKLKKKPKIKYGRIESDDETTGRRTRGKKINYLDVLGSDSDDEGIRRKSSKPIESEDEYVVNEDEEEQEQEDLETEKLSEEENQSESEEETAVPVISKLKVKPLKEPTPEPDEKSESMKRLAEEMQATVDSFNESPNNALEDNLKSYENELNPIDVINKNMEEMNEQEMEKMMEEEEYANRQLQLVALQIEKEKKRKEREAKKLEMLTMQEDLSTKKRSRKPKNLDFPPIPQSVSMMSSELQNNAELSEPPGVSLPMFGDMGVLSSSPEDIPKKRRGRGKGKKTLAAEQAATTGTTRPGVGIDIQNSSMNIDSNSKAAVMSMSSPSLPSQDPALQGNNLGIAAPPQPFSQSQPTPSVITRMLQSQPGQGGYALSGSPAYYPRNEQHVPDVPVSTVQGNTGQYAQQGVPRVQVPSPYRQGPPPAMPPQYPPHRNNPTISQVRPPGPPQLYHHSHRLLDPSPSGGGSINLPAEHTSPAIIPPHSDSSKSEPPPAVYNRPPPQQVPSRFPAANNTPARHLHMMSPHSMQQSPRTNSMPPYQQSGMPGTYYNSYPPPAQQPMEAGEEMLGYQTSSPYSEQFPNEGGTLGENSNSKSFDEESGGEFGGLVSYFSSQREDDLDT